jgi:hypothetical protein
MIRQSWRKRAQAIAFTSFLALIAAPHSLNAQELNQEITKYQRKNRGKADKIIENLYTQGRAIVIVSTLGVDHKYPTEAILDDNLADEVTDKGRSAAVDISMAMEWISVTDQESMVIVTRNGFFGGIGIGGWFLTQTIGNNHYMIYVVEPGTYSLSKISYPRPRSKLGEKNGLVSATGAAAIGELRQVASKMFEAEETMIFLNAATATVAATEQCNWWYKGVCTQSVYTPEYTKQVRAAGLYPKTEYLPMDALDVGIKFNDDVASFEVKAGEVVLVDGLFPQPLDADMGVANCRLNEAMQVCALQSMELVRANGSIDDLIAFDFSAEYYPRLEKLISGVQYRPLKLKGTQLGESKFGMRYRISR